MKRLISLVLMVMLLSTGAQAMEKASSMPDWDALERYLSFAEEGTVWTVRSNQTEAALAKMSAETAPYSGYACFGLELTGDTETGITAPVLAFYYAGSVKLNGEVASIAVNGTRYDLMLAGEEIALGKNKAERLTAPLNEEGLDMIREMLSAEEITVVLQGDVAFKMEPEKKETYNSTREELSARSLDGLADMLREFETMGEYGLWDLNEVWWERTRGVKPMMQTAALPAEDAEAEEQEIELEEPMYLLSRGDQGKDVKALQELLIEGGYLMGRADGGYGEGTVRAVRAAQTWFGLMPTGSADEKLIRLLQGDASLMDGEAVVSMEAVEMHVAEGLCELTVERSWVADAVESAGGDRRTASDKDDTLVIYEGTVKNISAEDLDFYWQMSAAVRCGEYEYPCVLVCERNEGASLVSALPPLAEARLLIYAEVPETVAGSMEWTLELQAGDASFTIE